MQKKCWRPSSPEFQSPKDAHPRKKNTVQRKIAKANHVGTSPLMHLFDSRLGFGRFSEGAGHEKIPNPRDHFRCRNTSPIFGSRPAIAWKTKHLARPVPKIVDTMRPCFQGRKPAPRRPGGQQNCMVLSALLSWTIVWHCVFILAGLDLAAALPCSFQHPCRAHGQHNLAQTSGNNLGAQLLTRTLRARGLRKEIGSQFGITAPIMDPAPRPKITTPFI